MINVQTEKNKNKLYAITRLAHINVIEENSSNIPSIENFYFELFTFIKSEKLLDGRIESLTTKGLYVTYYLQIVARTQNSDWSQPYFYHL